MNLVERNNVVAVDEKDIALREVEKMKAHREAILHRAFSVFIFNSKGEMLLHQRAVNKYHGAGLWTNACCSHPQWGEDVKESALERLQFEMGMQCEIEKAFSFVYNTPVENNLTEHEFDHVFIGYTDINPIPNSDEVQNYEWVNISELKTRIATQPELFTYWFRMAVGEVLEKISIK